MKTQNDRWQYHYNEVMQFMKDKKRRPSKHHVEEHRMLNWVKYNKKRLARGLLSAQQTSLFNVLLAMADKLRRLNQYAYEKPLPFD
jgi:hypothetical protein